MWEKVIEKEDVHKWKKVVDEEYCTFMENETQDLIELPKGRKVIESKWVFHIKRKANKYQAKLVGKGFSQTKGLDFYEIFVPITKFLSIKTLLALTTILDLEVHQIDVKSEFLNGCMKDIYMMQLKGYKNNHHKGLMGRSTTKGAIQDVDNA